MERRVLVVDDEESIRYVLRTVLLRLGLDVTCAGSAEEALPLLEDARFSVALFDIMLPDMSGIELLRHTRERSPETEVIMMTSHASAATAMGAIRCGRPRPSSCNRRSWPRSASSAQASRTRSGTRSPAIREQFAWRRSLARGVGWR